MVGWSVALANWRGFSLSCAVERKEASFGVERDVERDEPTSPTVTPSSRSLAAPRRAVTHLLLGFASLFSSHRFSSLSQRVSVRPSTADRLPTISPPATRFPSDSNLVSSKRTRFSSVPLLSPFSASPRLHPSLPPPHLLYSDHVYRCTYMIAKLTQRRRASKSDTDNGNARDNDEFDGCWPQMYLRRTVRLLRGRGTFLRFVASFDISYVSATPLHTHERLKHDPLLVCHRERIVAAGATTVCSIGRCTNSARIHARCTFPHTPRILKARHLTGARGRSAVLGRA